MVNIVVAFSRPEDGRNIKNILTKNGLPVAASCTSGAQVLAHADDLRSGIVVSGFRYGDMNCRQLRRALTPEFDIIVIASPSKWSGEEMGEIHCLPAPFKMAELVDSVRKLEKLQTERRRMRRRQPVKRSAEEQKVIDEAKELLMGRNGMTEPEAHKYLQKCSMDSGTGLFEAAQMVLRLFKDEAENR